MLSLFCVFFVVFVLFWVLSVSAQNVFINILNEFRENIYSMCIILPLIILHIVETCSACNGTTIVQEASNTSDPVKSDFFLSLSLSLCHSNLLSNPYVCDCHLTWLGQWLKKTRVVSGNPRCQKPAFLKEIPIQDVATPDFTCDGEPIPHSASLFGSIHIFGNDDAYTWNIAERRLPI